MVDPGGHARSTLSPTAHVARAEVVHAHRLAVVDGDVRLTYAELVGRVRQVAGAVAGADRVAVLAPNTHQMLEATLGVPAGGAVLVPLNTRLAPAEVAHLLVRAAVEVVLVDHELEAVVRDAIARSDQPGRSDRSGPEVIVMGGPDDGYERLLDASTPRLELPADERDVLSISFTSGTSGRPKGVVYSHRGEHLQALAMVAHAGLGPATRYLWTLPMFHCHGWSFPWAVTAAGGTHVCLRRVDPGEAWRLAAAESVTHLCGAPTVLTMLLADPGATAGSRPGRITAFTGGAPPSPALLARAEEAGVDVTHLYGLTETYGPSVISIADPSWADLPADERARLAARQGVANVVAGEVRVLDGAGAPVPPDGTTVGEVALRGDTVMLGYLDDPEGTAEAVPDGWFRTGDLAVLHDSGVVELVDRAKDIIISGGENIASVEVEHALAAHPAVLEAAVVGRPDERWGEVPVAYVTLADGATATVDELVAFAREHLAGFKVPRTVVFGTLPKSSTGKVQKVELRDRARAQAPDG